MTRQEQNWLVGCQKYFGDKIRNAPNVFLKQEKVDTRCQKMLMTAVENGKKGRHHRTITIEQDRVQMPTIDKNLRVRPSTQKHEDWVHSNSFCRLYMAYDVCPLISMQNNSKQITCIVATNIRR
ncbi:hypothetical protein RDWZM_001580 [Blomia tropicalis]|uniref:Uncharacterized protein n=1 Tax=Blomia tropicalis TaxID=40697 RepID=A0A9Q0MBU8_BLOTA|nr:hypothetical protein RDWZM_001580 [Blomia tropicalis]